jgi:hypothetical protein
MRTTISIYRQLGKWFETIDAEYAIAHPELLTAISTPNPALETGTDIEETPPQSSATSFAGTNSSYVTHSPFPFPAHTSMQDVTFPPSNATPPPTHPYLPSPSIDPHFCSGAYLGLGMSHLALSMMPRKLLALVELFGYKGDCSAMITVSTYYEFLLIMSIYNLQVFILATLATYMHLNLWHIERHVDDPEALLCISVSNVSLVDCTA